MGAYLRPRNLDDALAAIATRPYTILAGGTDFYPARATRARDEDVLDISAISGLRAVERVAAGWRIPALVTWSDIIDAKLPAAFAGLKQAAREVGGVQVQNTGTVCGNVCNASPAADGIPNLLALDAVVELASRAGIRTLPIQDFVLGNRLTARRPDEIVTAVVVPHLEGEARSTFRKLGARRYLVISIVMVAVVLAMSDKGTIRHARVAVGASAATALRLPLLESDLIGHELAPALEDVAAANHLASLAPIDDVRATADYRRHAELTRLRRARAGLSGGIA